MSALLFAIQALILVGGHVDAQPTDDWDFAADPARKLTVASVAYAEGSSLFAACLGDTLTVGVRGLPTASVDTRWFERRLNDGRTESSFWEGSDTRNILTSGAPARVARSLRNGGRLILSSTPDGENPIHIALDLPARATNVDRVLAACGRPLEAPHDRAPPLGALLEQTPAISPSTSVRHASFQVELNCIVADGRLSACLSEHQRPADEGLGAAIARNANGVRVKVSDPIAAEGGWVQIVVTVER